MRIDDLITLLENFQDSGITDISSFKYIDESQKIDMLYIKNDKYNIVKLNKDDWECSGKYRDGIWICEECAYKDECKLENEDN